MRCVLVLALIAGCAHKPAGELRFHNQPPIWHVNDRDPLKKPPRERVYYRSVYHTDGYFVRRLTRAMELRDPRRAEDVNSLDEVPSSTWFTNRIGVRDMSLDELRRGPNRQPGPFAQRPWTITKSKTGGMSLGFVFEDSTGTKYLLKFDEPKRPEMETAAHAIVHRIFWACGYNVPEDYIGYVRREELKVSPKATRRDQFGNSVAMTEDDLDRALDTIAREPDGRYRVLASRYLPGKPIGPYAREGTRPDDPNDRIPHEQRRSLRGQFALFAWLNHTDIQEDNTLDTFENGHVVHYLIDFGKALGVMGWNLRLKTVGYTHLLDLGMTLKSLLGFGLWQRPWELVEAPPLRGVGLFEVEHYDPGAWRANSPYWPLEDKDRFDAFWGAKLLMRFTPDQLEAIVAEGQLSDPRAAAYVLETLIARQRKTARYWFDRVAPLDGFTVASQTATGTRLCFTDLMLSYQLGTARTRYHVTSFDADGNATSDPYIIAGRPDGNTCAESITPGTTRNGYTIVRLRVMRGGRVLPDVRVHLARGADGALAVIGLRRE